MAVFKRLSNTSLVAVLAILILPVASHHLGANPRLAEVDGGELAVPGSIEEVLRELRPNVRSTQRLSEKQVYQLMSYGAEEGLMIFEVLNQMTMYLKETGLRAAIYGDDLRDVEEFFSLGDEQIEVLLPVSKIERVELGSTGGGNDSPFDVYLSEEHSDFLDVAYFDMETHFGFATVEESLFADGFGVRARRAFLRFRMSHMELQGDRRIRAHVHRFPRSRGMRFDAIERL